MTSQATVPPTEHPRGSWLLTVGRYRELGILFFILILGAAVTARSGNAFLSVANFRDILMNISILLIVALGQTIVILTGGIDLSVSSTIGLTAMMVAFTLVNFPTMPVLLLVPLSMALGAALGTFNGAIIAWGRVPPIIATLGTLAAFAGLAFLVAPDGKPVGVVTQPDFTWLATGRLFPELPLPELGGRGWTGVPILFLVFVVVALVYHVIMKYTDFGRAVYAIGGNDVAARLAGINLTRMKIGMYMLCGATAGLAGVLLTARTTSGNPINGVGFELQAITAVFLGGAATTGGKGTIVGTVLAVLLVGVLNNGMNLLGVGTFYQRVALGVLLIAAVALAQWRQARAERARTRTAVA